MYGYSDKQSGRLNLSASLVETIEVKGGNGPIVITLWDLPNVYQYQYDYGNDINIDITENDGTSLLRDRYYGSLSDLNGSSFSSRTKRITVEFSLGSDHGEFFNNSYLEWTSAGGYDLDPHQFCDCC